MSLEELKNKRKKLNEASAETIENIDSIIGESQRVATVANQSESILIDLDNEFKRQTGLNDIDIKFLFFATALQCTRQYVITPFEKRVTDKEAANKVKGEQTKETSNRMDQWYWPSLEEIITNPVPYDAIYGTKNFGLGFNGHNHRFKTLGHDPLLGWIFGVSNILTSTMTTWNFKSYHVKTGLTIDGKRRDKAVKEAETSKVLFYTKERLITDGMEGKKAFAYAVIKHAVHLKSDVYSKAGLPIPIISTISPEFAQTLAQYGIDMGNVHTVGKQATMSIMINTLIAMIHGMYYDKNKYHSLSLYEVKTRKIVSYSNLIASSSNLLYVGLTKNVKKMDIGGLLVTLYRLVNDFEFIQKVKEEFVFGQFNNLIRGKDFTFER